MSLSLGAYTRKKEANTTVDIALSRREEHRHAYWTMITHSFIVVRAEEAGGEVMPINWHGVCIQQGIHIVS